jgi:DNA primase
MPLRWSEVRPSLVPANFNIGNYKERLARRDAWEDFFRSRQSIKPAVKHLGKI